MVSQSDMILPFFQFNLKLYESVGIPVTFLSISVGFFNP